MLNKKYGINTDKITWRIIDQEAVILNLDNGLYYSLNKIGTFVWQALLKGDDLTKISESIGRDYNLSERTIRNDINSLINDFKKEKLVEIKR